MAIMSASQIVVVGDGHDGIPVLVLCGYHEGYHGDLYDIVL